MNVREAFLRVVPASWVLPARYYYWKLRGRLDFEMSLLGDLLKGGGRAIDVGANVGIYTYALAKHCRQVEAFEPLPACAAQIGAYGRAGITVHNVALSDRRGTASIFVPVVGGKELDGHASLRGMGGEGRRIEVPLRRLDDYGFRDVSFLKIDVEGHEWEVLQGARETIRREQPVIFAEIEQRHLAARKVEDVFDFILGLGYRGGFYSGGSCRPLAGFSVEKHQRPFLDDAASDAYINNFLFTPDGRGCP